jgi:hypothetical protein
MIVQPQASTKHGARRPGAGAKPSTVEGLLKRSSPKQAERLRRDIRRSALELLIDWARNELRRLRRRSRRGTSKGPKNLTPLAAKRKGV